MVTEATGSEPGHAIGLDGQRLRRRGGGTAARGMRSARKGVLVLALVAAAGGASAQQWTQSFALVTGWNAIYLHVQPFDSDPEQVFAGVPVASVWTRGVEPSSVEFIDAPADALLGQRGWLAYVPAGRAESAAVELADRALVNIDGNRAFLIHLDGAPTTLAVTGRPLSPAIAWQANAFTLTGFPIDPAGPPTFSAYFAPSSAHAGQPIYRLQPDGTWQRVTAPAAATMRYGEAYWVYSATGSDFVGPLAVEVPTSDGLSYGRSVPDHLLALRNLLSVPVTIAISDMASPAAVPLSYLKIVTTPGPDLGEFQWLPLEGSLQLPTAARAFQSASLAVIRAEFTSSHMGTVIAIRNGAGTRWLLPLSAMSGVVGGPAAALSGAGGGDSPFAGLWLGEALVNKVSQPQVGSMTPVSTIGQGNRCTGGINEGMACASAVDCPGHCTLTCAGGAAQGASCTVASQATDCPGSSCIAPPRTCAGGIDAGLTCSGQSGQCPGSTCETMGACIGGTRAGMPCTAAGQATDCPGSTCNTGSRCIGGGNADAPCSGAADCAFSCDPSGRGSEFPMRLLLHVDRSGQVRLLKQVLQMWQNGTTAPDPTEPGVIIDVTPGRFVLLTDDQLIPQFQGAALRDGVPVGRRLSTAFFDFPGNDLPMQGAFGGAGALSASIHIAPEFPTNPYRHKFHPDHDNRNDSGQPLAEALEITRAIGMRFSATDPLGRSAPDYGFDTVAGTYTEELSGLHRNTIKVEGTFRLKRVAVTPELNQ